MLGLIFLFFGVGRKFFEKKIQKKIFLFKTSLPPLPLIGNLDPEVDEKLIYDTFSAFGVILKTPNIQRDPETNKSKGFCFIEYASFEAADACIEAMNGQYLMNRAIHINYSFKKDAKGKERHGTAAERLLASQNPMAASQGPNMMFSDNKKGEGMSNTVPSTIQQALPPSLQNAPRFGAPQRPGEVGNRPPNFNPQPTGVRPGGQMVPNPGNMRMPGGNRMPPPPGFGGQGAPPGFGGMRAPIRPPPSHFSFTGQHRANPLNTETHNLGPDGLPIHGNLGIGMKPMGATHNSPLMGGIQYSGTIHKNGSAYSHLMGKSAQEIGMAHKANMQVFVNPKAPHL